MPVRVRQAGHRLLGSLSLYAVIVGKDGGNVNIGFTITT